MLDSLKPGDKVRLKTMDQDWVVSREACLIVQQIGDFSEHGIPLGARCKWVNGSGNAHEKVYSINDLAPA